MHGLVADLYVHTMVYYGHSTPGSTSWQTQALHEVVYTLLVHEVVDTTQTRPCRGDGPRDAHRDRTHVYTHLNCANNAIGVRQHRCLLYLFE